MRCQTLSGLYILKPPLLHALVIVTPARFVFVKDAVVLIQVAKLGSQVVVDIENVNRLLFHGHIPDLGKSRCRGREEEEEKE